jgi:hypothetical protein
MAKGGLGNIFDIFFGDVLTEVAAQLTRIEQKLDGLARAKKETDMAEKEQLDALLERVRANGDVIGSVKVAFEGQAEQLRGLAEQLRVAVEAGGADVSDEIKAAAEALAAQTEELRASIPLTIAAIQENT